METDAPQVGNKRRTRSIEVLTLVHTCARARDTKQDEESRYMVDLEHRVRLVQEEEIEATNEAERVGHDLMQVVADTNVRSLERQRAVVESERESRQIQHLEHNEVRLEYECRALTKLMVNARKEHGGEVDEMRSAMTRHQHEMDEALQKAELTLREAEAREEEEMDRVGVVAFETTCEIAAQHVAWSVLRRDLNEEVTTKMRDVVEDVRRRQHMYSEMSRRSISTEQLESTYIAALEGRIARTTEVAYREAIREEGMAADRTRRARERQVTTRAKLKARAIRLESDILEARAFCEYSRNTVGALAIELSKAVTASGAMKRPSPPNTTASRSWGRSTTTTRPPGRLGVSTPTLPPGISVEEIDAVNMPRRTTTRAEVPPGRLLG